MRYLVHITRTKLVDAGTKEEAEEKARDDFASDIEAWGIEDTVDDFKYQAQVTGKPLSDIKLD